MADTTDTDPSVWAFLQALSCAELVWLSAFLRIAETVSTDEIQSRISRLVGWRLVTGQNTGALSEPVADTLAAQRDRVTTRVLGGLLFHQNKDAAPKKS